MCVLCMWLAMVRVCVFFFSSLILRFSPAYHYELRLGYPWIKLTFMLTIYSMCNGSRVVRDECMIYTTLWWMERQKKTVASKRTNCTVLGGRNHPPPPIFSCTRSQIFDYGNYFIIDFQWVVYTYSGVCVDLFVLFWMRIILLLLLRSLLLSV